MWPLLIAAALCVAGCGGAGGAGRAHLAGGSGSSGGEHDAVTTSAAVHASGDAGDLGSLVDELLDTAPLEDPATDLDGPGIEIDIAREAGVARGPGITYDVAAESSVGMAASFPVSPERAAAIEAGRLARAETSSDGPDTATDGTSASLLIRTARFVVAVYQVRETIAAVRAVAGELGGFVAREAERVIVIRVPVARFEDAVVRVSGTGDVLRREIRTTDVGEEFHDNETRIATLGAMMTRLQELLARADDVAGALAVERELERVTLELERMRGRQRYLADRVAYATLAVELRELAHDEIEQADLVVLPFGWLRQLGLSRLLRLEGTAPDAR